MGTFSEISQRILRHCQSTDTVPIPVGALSQITDTVPTLYRNRSVLSQITDTVPIPVGALSQITDTVPKPYRFCTDTDRYSHRLPTLYRYRSELYHRLLILCRYFTDSDTVPIPIGALTDY